MSDYSDLLTETDPFRARVRTAASRHARAFDWFVASAAGWARAEFVRRVDADDVTPDEVDRLLVENVGRQVALLTTHLDLGATTGRRSHWTVHVGVLQAESHHEYLKLDAGAEDVVGMFDVMDVFELPEQWRVEPWPDFRPALTGTGESLGVTWSDTVTEVGAEGMWGADAKWTPGGREDEIEHVIQQAAQMTTVVRDRAARSYSIGTGADRIVLGRDWLLVLPDEGFEEAKLRIWNACEASEASRRAAWR